MRNAASVAGLDKLALAIEIQSKISFSKVWSFNWSHSEQENGDGRSPQKSKKARWGACSSLRTELASGMVGSRPKENVNEIPSLTYNSHLN